MLTHLWSAHSCTVRWPDSLTPWKMVATCLIYIPENLSLQEELTWGIPDLSIVKSFPFGSGGITGLSSSSPGNMIWSSFITPCSLTTGDTLRDLGTFLFFPLTLGFSRTSLSPFLVEVSADGLSWSFKSWLVTTAAFEIDGVVLGGRWLYSQVWLLPQFHFSHN